MYIRLADIIINCTGTTAISNLKYKKVHTLNPSCAKYVVNSTLTIQVVVGWIHLYSFLCKIEATFRKPNFSSLRYNKLVFRVLSSRHTSSGVK